MGRHQKAPQHMTEPVLTTAAPEPDTAHHPIQAAPDAARAPDRGGVPALSAQDKPRRSVLHLPDPGARGGRQTRS